MEVFLSGLISYLYGSIPFAYVAARVISRKNLCEEGTGNIGVTNAFKVGGTPVVIVTLLGEMSKAFLSIWLGRHFFQGDLGITLLCLYASFVGTNFSIFLKGKGGKGTTIVLWGMLVLSPYALLALLGAWALAFKVSKNKPGIRRAWLLSVPLVIFCFERNLDFALFGLLYSLLCYLKSLRSVDDYAYYGMFRRRASLHDEDQLHSQT